MSDNPWNPPEDDADAARAAAVGLMTGWVSAIAHNIRNPVAGVTGALEVIDRSLNDFQRTGSCDLALMQDSVRRMRERMASLTEYVVELADFAKPCSLRCGTIPVSAVMSRLKNSLKGVLPADASVRLVADADQVVYADPAKLNTILKALAVNALEAVGPSARPEVEVRVSGLNSGGVKGQVVIVDDNGPGIPLRHRDRAFEPFWSTKEAGTGLGLTIARKYAEAHGGWIGIGAAPGGGARVTLFLPDFPAGGPVRPGRRE